jgi:hypothetical protein
VEELPRPHHSVAALSQKGKRERGGMAVGPGREGQAPPLQVGRRGAILFCGHAAICEEGRAEARPYICRSALVKGGGAP